MFSRSSHRATKDDRSDLYLPRHKHPSRAAGSCFYHGWVLEPHPCDLNERVLTAPVGPLRGLTSDMRSAHGYGSFSVCCRGTDD